MIDLPVLLNLNDVDRIRDQSQYGDHSLGILLYALAYGRCLQGQERPSRRNKPLRFLEIGFNLGYSALMMTAALVESGMPGRVLSIDQTCPAAARQTMARQGRLWARHRLLIGDSLASVDRALAILGAPIDLLFIDGDHSYPRCKQDFDAYAPYVADDGLVLFHDNYHEPIRQAIQEIYGWRFIHLGGWGGVSAGSRIPF